MTRIPGHTIADAPSASRSLLEDVAPFSPTGKLLNLHAQMAHAPAVLAAYTAIRQATAAHGTLEPQVRCRSWSPAATPSWRRPRPCGYSPARASNDQEEFHEVVPGLSRPRLFTVTRSRRRVRRPGRGHAGSRRVHRQRAAEPGERRQARPRNGRAGRRQRRRGTWRGPGAQRLLPHRLPRPRHRTGLGRRIPAARYGTVEVRPPR